MFQFATAARVLFGAGTAERLGGEASQLMTRALLVTGANTDRHEHIIASLRDADIVATQLTITHEPTIEEVDAATKRACEAQCDGVISVGGGSAIDAGKAIAALVSNPGGALRYVEVIGEGLPLTRPGLAFVAVPTTAGTGAEVTKNAVLASQTRAVKVSLRHQSMLPRLAIVDSLLTHEVPRALSVATGLDALTQVIEPFVSPRANPLTDGLCREAIRRAPQALRRVAHDLGDAEARDDMALVSLFGGLALANSKLGAVHGLAGPLGGALEAHHGALCARLLPLVVQANLQALVSRSPDNPCLHKFRELAILLTGSAHAQAKDAVTALSELTAELGTVPFGRYGLLPEQFDPLIDSALRSSSMQGNPLQLERDELRGILEAAM